MSTTHYTATVESQTGHTTLIDGLHEDTASAMLRADAMGIKSGNRCFVLVPLPWSPINGHGTQKTEYYNKHIN